MANTTAHGGVDYLTLDYEGFRQMMIDKLKEKLPEYTDYSETDMGIVLIELLAHGLDIISYYRDRQALECFLPTARQRKNVITHCKMFGYTLRSASPAVFSQIFEKTEGVEFRTQYTPNDTVVLRTVAESGQNPIYFEVIGGLDENGNFSKEFRLASDEVGNETVEVGGQEVYKHRAVIIAGRTIWLEVMGVSDGTANQKFTTSKSPVMSYDTRGKFGDSEIISKVYVVPNGDEPSVANRWTKTDNFLLSNTQSKHYTFSVNEFGEGVIEFGNDSSGKIPPAGSIIYCTYRIGGGEVTNVGANTILEMETPVNSILKTYNPFTADFLGYNEESIEEAKIKAPALLRTLDRAVTIRDYADIGLLHSGILSAESALCCVREGNWSFVDKDDNVVDMNNTRHYQRPVGVEVDGYTLLMYVWAMPKNPVSVNDDTGEVTEGVVALSPALLDELTTYYDERRMVGQRITYWEYDSEEERWKYDATSTHIQPAKVEYVKPIVKISVEVGYTPTDVAQAVCDKLAEIMKLGNYRLEQDLVWSDLVTQLIDLDNGVEGLKSVTFVEEEVEVSGHTKYYIAEDKQADFGYAFALKPKPPITVDEKIVPQWDITVIIDGVADPYYGYSTPSEVVGE